MSNATLPYLGTEGFSGTDTSEEGARTRAETAAERQDRTVALADTPDGITVKELRDLPWIPHHGVASSTLTVLHKAGRLARLVDKRDKCKIYITPERVEGRLTEPFTGNRKRIDTEDVEAIKKGAAIAALRALRQDLHDAGVRGPSKNLDGLAHAEAIIDFRISQMQ
jgi:hypothetical protein